MLLGLLINKGQCQQIKKDDPGRDGADTRWMQLAVAGMAERSNKQGWLTMQSMERAPRKDGQTSSEQDIG